MFYEAFYEILDEKVFNNREQLLAYTKYHSEMYFVNAVEFQQRNSFTDNGIMEYDSPMTFHMQCINIQILNLFQ